MKSVTANARYWIAGVVCAFVGVALAKFVAPQLDGIPRALLAAGGFFLAGTGLTIICVGVSRRVKRESALAQEKTQPS